MPVHGRLWLSAHLPLPRPIYSGLADDAITCFIEPLIENFTRKNLVDAAFFIRYTEGGQHLRLRVLPADDAFSEMLSVQIHQSFEAHRRVAWKAYTNSDPMAWQPYTPETDRYGGEYAISFAEQMFYHSSTLAFALLKDQQMGERSTRLGRATVVAALSCYEVLRSATESASCMSDHSASYGALLNDHGRLIERFRREFHEQREPLVNYLRACWDAMESGTEVLPELADYRRALVEYRANIKRLFETGKLRFAQRQPRTLNEALALLLSSIVHMTNNRLGLTVAEESYISFLIANAISEFK
jgi:thiopeptide-type bacteriocin biosynthesis protein